MRAQGERAVHRRHLRAHVDEPHVRDGQHPLGGHRRANGRQVQHHRHAAGQEALIAEYSNTKWLFAIRDGAIVGRHLIRDNEQNWHGMLDPEALVRSGSVLGVVDAGNTANAGTCFAVSQQDATAQTCRLNVFDNTAGQCGTFGTKATCLAATDPSGRPCGWIDEGPSTAGRTQSTNYRSYSYFRFTEPTPTTTSINVIEPYIQGAMPPNTNGWDRVLFSFPATGCGPGSARPCGQLGDIVPAGHALRQNYNIEAAAVVPGDRLILFSKAVSTAVIDTDVTPDTRGAVNCTNGYFSFWPAGTNSNPVRIDNGDVHVFEIANFSTRAETTAAATYRARFSMSAAPYLLNPAQGNKITDASYSNGYLYFQTKDQVFRAAIDSGTAIDANLFGATCAYDGPPNCGTTPCAERNEGLAAVGSLIFHGSEQNSTSGIGNAVWRYDHNSTALRAFWDMRGNANDGSAYRTSELRIRNHGAGARCGGCAC